MPSFKLKAPKTIKDMRLRHLAAYTSKDWLENSDNPTEETVVNFLATFFGHTPELIWSCDWGDLKKVYNHCIKIFGSFEMKAPPKEITVKGIEYQLVNFKRPTAAWMADVSLADFQKHPWKVAAISYIPKGTTYGEIDEHQNVRYPMSSREEDFKEHFPMDTWLQLQAFFLRRFERSIGKHMAIQRAKRKGKRARKRLKQLASNGWKRLTSWPKILGSRDSKQAK